MGFQVSYLLWQKFQHLQSVWKKFRTDTDTLIQFLQNVWQKLITDTFRTTKPSLGNGLTFVQFSSGCWHCHDLKNYELQIIHAPLSLSIPRKEVVTKQTEGYSQQQQEEEEEILVFQVGGNNLCNITIIIYIHHHHHYNQNHHHHHNQHDHHHYHDHYHHRHQAGASLIAPGVVLTAAHKVAEFE